MDLKAPNERLDFFLRKEGISQTDIAERIGSSQPTISAILKGTRPLSRGMLSRIGQAVPNLNIDWVTTGQGDRIKLPQGNAKFVGSPALLTPDDDALIFLDFIPVSARASFVENLLTPDISEVHRFPLLPLPDERSIASRLKIFEVAGRSMEPTIPDHALILVEEIPSERWHSVSGPAVVIFKEFVTVKRISKNNLETQNHLILSADNPDPQFGQMTVQRSDIRAIFRAIRIISSHIH